MKKIVKWFLYLAGFAVLIPLIIAGVVLSKFELQGGSRTGLNFQHRGHQLAGTLLLPKGEGPFAVTLFVHGDGPLDRFANGYYNLIMNALLEKGIAVYSWDKQGVGQSEGNWQLQTMADRAQETLNAMRTVAKRDEIRAGTVGLLGFSQGGWVLPEVARQSTEAAFYIIVGGAVDWQSQSEYLTKTRMAIEGYSTQQIESALKYSRRMNARLFKRGASYDEYRAVLKATSAPPGVLTRPMDRERYTFVDLNFNADARAGLEKVASPFLALLGEDDLNVDAKHSAEVYREILGREKKAEYQIELIPNATHALLRSDRYNFQLPSQWTALAILGFLLEGKDAYAPGILDLLGSWIVSTTQKENVNNWIQK